MINSEILNDRWLVLFGECIKESQIKSVSIERDSFLPTVRFTTKDGLVYCWFPTNSKKLDEELSEVLNGK